MQNIINAFIDDKNIAIVGASENKKKFGNMMVRTFKKKGYNVFPVNPKSDTIEGEKCYSTIKELPSDVINVLFTVPPAVTEQVVKECPDAGVKRVWMHRGAGKGAVSETAKEFCKENNIDVVYGVCPMMFLNVPGPHKFHYWLLKLFGGLPKELKN